MSMTKPEPKPGDIILSFTDTFNTKIRLHLLINQYYINFNHNGMEELQISNNSLEHSLTLHITIARIEKLCGLSACVKAEQRNHY